MSCPFIHFPSFQPVGGTERASPGSSVRSPEGCSISSKKKKIIKAASAPAARKVPIPSAGYLEKQSDSRSEAVAAATEPGNSNAGGGLFLILPSIYPAQELPSLLFLPSFKVGSVLSSPELPLQIKGPWYESSFPVKKNRELGPHGQYSAHPTLGQLALFRGLVMAAVHMRVPWRKSISVHFLVQGMERYPAQNKALPLESV